MGQTCGKLAQSRQALRAASFFLCLLETAVGLRQFLSQQPIAPRLPSELAAASLTVSLPPVSVIAS